LTPKGIITMPETAPQESSARLAPHAARQMASMFDDVSGRYDLLNRLMTLGRDRAWRAAMWRAVPEPAAAVLDLCTGNGVSLAGLRRPGRLVVGIDVSPVMLERALERFGRSGWAPRLAAADAFHLPLRTACVDAVTIAFGLRNLRPRLEALAEIARVLRPGGTLAVLEAAAPRPGWFAPLHSFHLRHLVPLLGRLSPDPSAYQYLSRSIFEFGSGPEFESDLAAAHFERVDQRSFMLGASRLWVYRRAASGVHATGSATRDPRAFRDEPALERNAAPAAVSASAAVLQNAIHRPVTSREMPQSRSAREHEWRWWLAAQLATSLALFVALAYGLWVYGQLGSALPLLPWQRRGLVVLLAGGIVAFAVRTAILAVRLLGPPER
jgi:demethylmenaquinone methyltransferase/2-methoxy-6-polyprenyl-1,4-benzoquinol methylase